jgi:uncharacterized protein with GYD domain
MKRVANIELKPTPDQAKSLHDTPERCNAACNEISKRGLDAGKTASLACKSCFIVPSAKSSA